MTDRDEQVGMMDPHEEHSQHEDQGEAGTRPGFFKRITRWFRRDGGENDQGAIQRVETSRSTFLRPWAKYEEQVKALRESFTTLTDLMGSIRDSIDRQTQRQEQFTDALRALPQIMQSVPESQKVQTETLRVMVGQMEQQNAQQARLGEILDKVSSAHAGQREVLENLGQRVETLSAHDQAISDNLRNVSTSLQDASRHSQSSAQVLQQLRDQFATQGGELERVLQRQNTRFTTMLAVAIFLSVAALVSVVIVGYLMLNR